MIVDLADLKTRLTAVEDDLTGVPFLRLHTFPGERPLHLCLTDRLRKRARKGRVWKSTGFLTAMKNAAYGYQEGHTHSRGGADGIFALDRSFTPANRMMSLLFAGYLDKPRSGAKTVAVTLGVSVEDLKPVRLVSHHMRLLGLISRQETGDWLVLVDYDDTK
ncbi:MAG: hypothetical protein ACI8RZ_000404 [Myxococcota bacterium]